MVINIKEAYKPILFVLFPSYTEVKEIQKPDSFIITRDVKTQMELHKLSQYKDCLVLSNVLFDEQWDEKKLIEMALEFRRVNFKSRKKTLHELEELRDSEFCDALITFTLTGELPLAEGDILPLLETVGSMMFVEKYFETIQQVPEKKVQAAILTFLTKVKTNMTDSLFYKKKALQFKANIEKNLITATRDYQQSDKSSLAFVNYIVNLTTNRNVQLSHITKR